MASQAIRRNIVLFGAPGVGKGTYGKLIQNHFGFKQFSMGDYFRKIINETDKQSHMSQEEQQAIAHLRDTLRKGHFVSDEEVLKIINIVRNHSLQGEKVVLLDGVPRTVAQAEKLPEFGINIDLIFNFYSKEDIIMEKLMGRRVCPSCNRNYNVAHIDRDGYYMKALLPEKRQGFCDTCPDVRLVVRDDDKENIIKERLEIYKQKTQPILDFYKDKPETKIISFEAKKGVDDFPAMKKLLEDAIAPFKL